MYLYKLILNAQRQQPSLVDSLTLSPDTAFYLPYFPGMPAAAPETNVIDQVRARWLGAPTDENSNPKCGC